MLYPLGREERQIFAKKCNLIGSKISLNLIPLMRERTFKGEVPIDLLIANRTSRQANNLQALHACLLTYLANGYLPCGSGNVGNKD